MKKQFVIAFLFCAVASLVCVSSGFSWDSYDGGCGTCHGATFAEFPHNHDTSDCTACHVVSGDSPATSKCAGCHTPGGDPIECPLVIDHGTTSCLPCHAACDVPVGCATDEECGDDVFCNGVESCSKEGSETTGVCVPGTDPCIGDTPACIEEGTGTCVECVIDGDCAAEETCEGNLCVGGGCPEGTPDEVVTFDKNGDCLLNKEELKNYSDTLKVAQKAEKDALKAKQSLEKDKYKAIKINFSN